MPKNYDNHIDSGVSIRGQKAWPISIDLAMIFSQMFNNDEIQNIYLFYT